MKNTKIMGQAMIEYLLVLSLLSFVGVKSVKMLGKFMGESMGNLADVISIHLTVGVCGRQGQFNCYFSNYKNGREN